MSTNYYLHLAPSKKCPCCGHQKQGEVLHIGLSAVGWVFQLHSIPERGLTSIEAWREALRNPENVILDEYEREVSAQEMLNKIEDPHQYRNSWENYFSEVETRQKITETRFHTLNRSQRGPRGLLRVQGGGWEPEEGPCFDLVEGDFS